MILITVGTNEQPFDRLVRAAACLDPDEPLLVQYGASREPHGAGEWVDFLPFDQLELRMRAARVVVAHAGVGSIMLARRCGHRPIVVPRRLHLDEAVDDHQLPFARRLAGAGAVELVEDVLELPGAIRLHASGPAVVPVTDLPGSAELAGAIGRRLDALGAGLARR